MKRKFIKLCFLFSVVATGSLVAQNQKIGFYESDFVLSKIPEYNGIEQRLQLLSEGWKDELKKIETEIKTLEDDFDAKEILYTDEIRTQKRQDISRKKTERDTFINQKFGPDGEYFKKQKEFLEPIQRQMFTAIRTVAQKQGYDYIFDRSGDLYMVYARSEWNLNEAILLELGIELDDTGN